MHAAVNRGACAEGSSGSHRRLLGRRLVDHLVNHRLGAPKAALDLKHRFLANARLQGRESGDEFELLHAARNTSTRRFLLLPLNVGALLEERLGVEQVQQHLRAQPVSRHAM